MLIIPLIQGINMRKAIIAMMLMVCAMFTTAALAEGYLSPLVLMTAETSVHTIKPAAVQVMTTMEPRSFNVTGENTHPLTAPYVVSALPFEVGWRI